MDIINLKQEEFREKQFTNLNVILNPDPGEVGEHINKLQKKCGEIYISEKDVFNILCIFCENYFEEAQHFFTHIRCDHEEGESCIAKVIENDPLEIRSDNGNQEEMEPTINEKIKCENVVFPENSAFDESKTQNLVENILIGDNFENELETRKDSEVKNKNTELCNVCYKTFKSKKTLRRHKVREQPKKKTKSKTQSQVETDEKHDGEQSKEDEKSLEWETDDPLKCKYCGRRLAHKSTLKEHMRIHTGERPYQCQTCAKQFRTASCARRHEKTHNDIRQFKCENIFIGDNFENELETRKDSEVKNKNTEFCNVCYKTFKSKKTLQRHKVREQPKKKTKSKTQSQVETDENNDGEQSKDDEKSLEYETDDPLKCKYCGRRLADNFTLKEHVRIHTGERPYQCQICGKQFRTSSCIRIHEKSHNIIRQYKCEKCGSTFKSKITLYAHSRRHREKEIKCNFCDQLFSTNADKVEHERVHTGEKPFKCNFCGKCFQTSGGLSRHTKIHTGIRPHKCQYCDRSFAAKAVLNNHVVIHTGERPFVCTTCSATFPRKEYLKSHKKIHSDYREYVCKICGDAFKQYPTLNVHMKKHKIKVTD